MKKSGKTRELRDACVPSSSVCAKRVFWRWGVTSVKW